MIQTLLSQFSEDANRNLANSFIVQTPEVFQEFDNQTEVDPSLTSLYNSSLEVQPLGPHTCIGEDGLNTTCEFDDLAPPPPALDNGFCKNVVVKVSTSRLKADSSFHID